MNEPLTHNGLTFYQSGFNDAGHGIKTSTLSVGRDPGRVTKYAGCLLICLGIATMFYMRAYFFKRTSPPRKEAEVLGREIPSNEKEIATQASEPSPAPEMVLSGPQEVPGTWEEPRTR